VSAREHVDAAFEAEYGFCRVACAYCDDLDAQDRASGIPLKPLGQILAEVFVTATPETEKRFPRPGL
jgi:hypothetical protein